MKASEYEKVAARTDPPPSSRANRKYPQDISNKVKLLDKLATIR